MGLNHDLKLKGNDFTNAATAFFAAYMVAEVPTGQSLGFDLSSPADPAIVYILNKVPVAKWLGVNVVLWGIATACIAAAHDYRSLLAARIFLGIFEAPIAPCLMLISSQWYTKSEQSPRFAFWYCGLGVGQIVGGLLSYGFQQVKRHDFQGWRIMFVVLGCATVVVGFAAILVLPDTPMSAGFLSVVEKSASLSRVSDNRTGVLNRRFKPAHILEAILDPQLWLLTFMTVLVSLQPPCSTMRVC